MLETPRSTNLRPLWVLSTRSTAYAFGLDATGSLEHVYWGARLPVLSDYQAPPVYGGRFEIEGYTHEEFPVWGGFKFNEPALKVRFADGVRGVVLNYTDTAVEHGEGVDTLTITLDDAYYPLRVRLIYRVFEAYDLIERSAVIVNTGDTPIDIEQILSASWELPRRDSYTLTTLNGKWGGEFQVQQVELPMGKQVIERRRGASGFDSNPFFALAPTSDTTERHGEVWFGALAFSGNWKLVIERTAFEQVAVAGGINDFDFLWKLEPGETFETPVFVGGYTESGYGEASRLLHAYEIEHVLPSDTARQPRPVVYNSWYVTEFDVNYENQAKAAEIAARLGVEMFVMDDGWFGQRNHDRAGLGDWHVNLTKFPNGLKPLIDRVNELGMGFGIWVEPEMVNPDSDLYRAHPDWIYHFPNRPRSLSRNQSVLNVSRPDVQEYIVGFLDDLLSNNDIKFVKWDMNRHFSEPGWTDAPSGRDREIWVRHTQGIYDILRQVRARHPGVIFESCSGGGGRVDLGVMRYAEQFWMSDNTDPYDDLFIEEGFTLAHAPLTRMMWVTDPIHVNDRATSLEYRFHVAMMGALGIGANLTRWSEADLTKTAEFVAQYKAIRETVQFGKLYRLRSPRESILSAFEFVHPDGHEAVAFAFLSASNFGEYRAALRLQGLEPDARYRVDGRDLVLSGTALMKQGIPLAMKGTFASQMLRLERVS
ncbi:MAG: alpha-galactosidase [Anaerolineae bacterium]|nr:alpha-galactosidase [Anaerolineae bacterium]